MASRVFGDGTADLDVNGSGNLAPRTLQICVRRAGRAWVRVTDQLIASRRPRAGSDNGGHAASYHEVMADGNAVRVKIAETPGEWTGLVAVRLAVFCDEQGVPISAELDEHDRNAVHALAVLPSDGVAPDGLAVARRGTAMRASAQAGRYLPLSLAGARGGHRDDGAVARAVGGARLLRSPNGVAQIGRVAVLPAWRGQGLGVRLLRLLEELALARGYREAVLHAQLPVQGFYERQGYAVDTRTLPFDEDGIRHVRMTKPLSLDM